MKDEHSQSTNPVGFWLGLFIGGLAGLVTVAMLSTKEGRRIAKNLKKILNKMIAEWEERLAEVEEEAEDKKRLVQQSLGELKEKVSHKIEEEKSKVIDKVHQGIHQAAGLPQPPKEGNNTQSKRYFKKGGEPLK